MDHKVKLSFSWKAGEKPGSPRKEERGAKGEIKLNLFLYKDQR